MSALGHKQPVDHYLIVACGRLLPDAYRSFSWKIANRCILNGCFNQQQSFKLVENPYCEGQESARSGRCRLVNLPRGVTLHTPGVMGATSIRTTGPLPEAQAGSCAPISSVLSARQLAIVITAAILIIHGRFGRYSGCLD